LDVKQLQTFIVLARLLNFRATAEELNYSQSTVSDHIRNLEQELGVKLFERLGRKVFLNEEGKKLISPALKMLPVETDNILIHAKMIYHVNKWMSAPLEALKDIVLLKKDGKVSSKHHKII